MLKLRTKGWKGHMARRGEKINPYRAVMLKSKGKRSAGRLRRRKENNIEIELKPDCAYISELTE